MNISCVVIDANQQSVGVLIDSVKQFGNQIDLVAEFDNPLLAFDFLKEHKIDFVFVAPEFKDTLGHQTILKLENKPLFIITNTDSESGVGGFFSNNADYILSPPDYSTFFQTITAIKSLKSD